MQTSLGRKLRLLRVERQMSLREAAARAGVVKETISDIERGLTHPHDVTLGKLAKAYGVPVEDLLEEPVPFAETPKAGRTTPFPPNVQAAEEVNLGFREVPPERFAEQHPGWEAAIDKARRLREDARAPIEELLAAWRESKEREDEEEQLAHLNEIARLMDEIYLTETDLGWAYVKAATMEGEASEGPGARRLRSESRKMVLFYEELIGLIKDAGVPVRRRDEGEAVEETSAPVRPEALALTVH